MKANVFYRIKLKELEATTLKHLPRYEADDTEEIREKKSEKILEVIDILEELEQDIKEDESSDFKESARLRLVNDVRRHRLDISFAYLDLYEEKQDLANRFLRLNLDLANGFSEILYGYELVADLAWSLDKWIDDNFFETYFRMDDEFIAILYGIFEIYEESQRNRKSRMEIPELIEVVSNYDKQLKELMDFLLEVGKIMDEGKLKGKRMSYDFSEFQKFLDCLVDEYDLLDNFVW
ncbi:MULTISPECIES: hypothetical protein [unclassified Streptococcus]|uniref:hypothetical protein n=1 Tax=unclassified Streptococcus TaxID=2608887 RepID=UPI001072D20D|nr:MULTISPECIES: hypothetical protein [unclassified Streptococcus]MBF0805963.1 hypothetical protein [Streptococcus sp. 19428wA2_WM07]TFU28487.1 hypothetical protein E4T71_04010 [Streptococcus sp. WM07]